MRSDDWITKLYIEEMISKKQNNKGNQMTSLIEILKQATESRFSKPPTVLKWKPSNDPKYNLATSFAVPTPKDGLMVSGKAKTFFESKLSKLLGITIDLTNVKNFFPDGRSVSFTFSTNDVNYKVTSGGATAKTSYYNIYKHEG